MIDFRRCIMRRFLMRDIDRVFELRKNMIDDWKHRGLEWRQIVDKYRVSKRWFYKLRMRFLLQGYEGLKDNVLAQTPYFDTADSILLAGAFLNNRNSAVRSVPTRPYLFFNQPVIQQCQ
jgi:hypothetical protein